jgi:hypothetical protein
VGRRENCTGYYVEGRIKKTYRKIKTQVDNIKIDLGYIRWDGMYWIVLD